MAETWKGPLEVESRKSGDGDGRNYLAFAITDASGAAICDTLNSDVTEIREESDGDENGLWINRWDERGKADMQFLAHAGNCYYSMLEALKAAEVILRLSNHDFSTNDMGKFRNITLLSAHREVLAALAKTGE